MPRGEPSEFEPVGPHSGGRTAVKMTIARYAATKRDAVMAAQRQLEELKPQLDERNQARLESAQKQLDAAASSPDDSEIQAAVQQLFSESRGVRNSGQSTLTRRFYNDPKVIAQLQTYFRTNTLRQPDGVIDTLYVLEQGFDTAVLKAEESRVRYILDEASKLGPKASKEASRVSQRLAK